MRFCKTYFPQLLRMSSIRPADIAPRQADPRRSTKQPQQHLDALATVEPLIEPGQLAERAARGPDPIAASGPGWLRQLDQSIALSASQLLNDAIRHPRGRAAVEHDPGDTRRPTRRPPAAHDQNERIARKQ